MVAIAVKKHCMIAKVQKFRLKMNEIDPDTIAAQAKHNTIFMCTLKIRFAAIGMKIPTVTSIAQ